MVDKSIKFALILITLAVVVSMAGCTAPATDHKTTLVGKDVFDPSKFSMATYTLAAGGIENIGLLTVLGYPGEKDGDRLSSVSVAGNVSSRMDVWLDRKHEEVNNATMTIIDDGGMQTMALPKALNMTTMDQTWNTPGSTYAYYGTDSVTVPAGESAARPIESVWTFLLSLSRAAPRARSTGEEDVASGVFEAMPEECR
jgi:hypothetical protein